MQEVKVLTDFNYKSVSLSLCPYDTEIKRQWHRQTDALLEAVAGVISFAPTISRPQVSPLRDPQHSLSADTVTVLSRLESAADLRVIGSSTALWWSIFAQMIQFNMFLQCTRLT